MLKNISFHAKSAFRQIIVISYSGLPLHYSLCQIIKVHEMQLLHWMKHAQQQKEGKGVKNAMIYQSACSNLN